MVRPAWECPHSQSPTPAVVKLPERKVTEDDPVVAAVAVDDQAACRAAVISPDEVFGKA